MTKRLTTEEFIEKSVKKWGNKFDYSKTVYVNSKTRVTIGCPIHGDIQVLPESHTMDRPRNTGCPKCGSSESIKNRTIQFDEFLEIAHDTFQGRYKYVESSWKGIKESIDYICPDHGLRSMKAESHIQKRVGNTGCKKCGIEKRASEIRMSFMEFSRKAKLIHGDQYEYDEAEFKDAVSVVRVKCRAENHGYFFPVARDHLNGTSCPECKGLKKKTNEVFIRDAQKTHGSSYGYEKSEYKGARRKVVITCYVHGDFLQEPINHINGSGCPDCALLKKGWDNLPDLLKEESKHLENCQLYIYSVAGYGEQIKVGISSDHKRRSYSSFGRNLPYGEKIALWECQSRIHARLIELLVLQVTRNMFNPPLELSNLSGFYELRKCLPDTMTDLVQAKFDEFYMNLEQGGNEWEWALKNIRMPDDIKDQYLNKVRSL